MQYNFAPFKDKLKGIEEWLKKELSQIRTGRATPTILDGILVESYGSKMPINQVAGISSEDPRSLRITPWDMSQVKNIEKAIAMSNLGLATSVDEKGVRVIFPELSSERRQAFVKIARGKLEDSKTTVRKERDHVWDDIQKKEKEGGMSEDEKFRFKADMQKLVDEVNKHLEEMVDRKEKEVNA